MEAFLDFSRKSSQEPYAVLTSIHSSSAVVVPAREFTDKVLALCPAVAVFDCDGTLWSRDSGYEFMVWSIEQGILSRNSSDWIDSRYRLYLAGEIAESPMCGEMAQIYDGLSESEVRTAAASFFRSRIAGSIFPQMRALTDALAAQGSELWAVSSTNNWVIEEGVRSLHIPPERVRAVRVEVAQGKITSKLLDVPSGPGKVASLAAAGVVLPDAVFGNSIHDAEMLQATRHPFPVNPSPALLRMAAERGWPVFYPEQSFPQPA